MQQGACKSWRETRLQLENESGYLGDRVRKLWKDNAVWVCCSAQGYGSIFGLNQAARNKARTRSKRRCKFHFRRQPNCNRVFRWIYWVFEASLPKWRSVAVARSPSLRERCACWVYAQPRVRSLLLTSRSKSRRLWMQRSIKKNHTLFMQRRDDVELIWWLTQRLLHMNNFYLQLQLCAYPLRACC